MAFSKRTPEDMSPNGLSQALEEHSGPSPLDLTVSNPTECGFEYPPDLLKALADPAALRYQPEPFGLPKAREAVAAYLGFKGLKVDPSSVSLTSGTSESYSYIFKLLGDPGDRFLTPKPGYPLLEHLTQLEGLEALPYSLQPKKDWPLDQESVLRALSRGPKGLILVEPQNPTGCFLSGKDRSFLEDLCRERNLALLQDDVFSDYTLSSRTLTPLPPDILSFRMGGLSKSLGLPQLKLAWTVLSGPPALLEECQKRLELIADSYLTLGTPVQWALPEFLRFAPSIQGQINRRLFANRAILEKGLSALPGVTVWPTQGGWYALLQLQMMEDRPEEGVLELLKKAGVLVHPGGFYDLPTEGFWVLSLLPESGIFEEGISRIRKFLEQKLG